MPIHQYECELGHVTEKIFRSFMSAKDNSAILCRECDGYASRKEFSTPFPAQFLGNPEGYYKPSPTKRFSTKLVSQNDGNAHSGG